MSIARKPLHSHQTRHWQLSLRTLLLLVLVAGPVIGFGGPALHSIAQKMMHPTPTPTVLFEPDCILWDDDWPYEPNEFDTGAGD